MKKRSDRSSELRAAALVALLGGAMCMAMISCGNSDLQFPGEVVVATPGVDTATPVPTDTPVP